MNLQKTIRRILREEVEIPILIRRRFTQIEELFNKLTEDININEFDDLEDFHNSIVHNITEELCDDLDSYNLFYEYIDQMLTKKIERIWRKNKKK